MWIFSKNCNQYRIRFPNGGALKWGIERPEPDIWPWDWQNQQTPPLPAIGDNHHKRGVDNSSGFIYHITHSSRTGKLAVFHNGGHCDRYDVFLFCTTIENKTIRYCCQYYHCHTARCAIEGMRLVYGKNHLQIRTLADWLSFWSVFVGGNLHEGFFRYQGWQGKRLYDTPHQVDRKSVV